MTNEIVQSFAEAIVPCEGMTDTPLGKTYMPLPVLKRRCADLGVAFGVPFLKLPAERDQAFSEWEFLKTFNVGHEGDLDFYIAILRCFRNSFPAKDLRATDKLSAIYSEIEKHRRAADDAKLRLVRGSPLLIID